MTSSLEPRFGLAVSRGALPEGAAPSRGVLPAGATAVRDPLGETWDERRERQRAVLPSGRVLVSCSAPFGQGGLGRHLREIVEALERGGRSSSCVCVAASTDPAARPTLERGARTLPGLGARALEGPLGPLTRASPGWRTWAANVGFDAGAARRMTGAEHLIAFNGQALAQARAARRAGWASVSLMSANSHMRHVAAQHALALRRYPLERSWPARQVARNLREYAAVDRIYVATDYAWASFVDAGIPESRLAVFPLIPDPRYRPADENAVQDSFDVVYVGSLTVAKGVPLLIDAVRRLPAPELRLVLVGGWGTRGMRRFVQSACARDPRIVVCPGDPLPHLRRAAVCVHATYEDGFAYAPAEALACGVPVIVSEDTGMKELIEPGRDGLVVPTGDLDVLVEAIDSAYRGELFGG